jgi:hypothetical protein
MKGRLQRLNLAFRSGPTLVGLGGLSDELDPNSMTRMRRSLRRCPGTAGACYVITMLNCGLNSMGSL